MKQMRKLPLSGLNVVDFGWYYAGPMAGMLLADQGANVVRIVRPGEPEVMPQQYRLLNRNKRLLELDLKTEEGKAQALALIKKADVLIENFRPGVMKRLGLDYSTVKKVNPRLVYMSLPGFSATDKEKAHIQAWEGVLGAAACLFTETNWTRKVLQFPPLYTSVPVSSMYGAAHGVIAVMAALLAREKHGVGTVIEVVLADAGKTGFGFNFAHTSIVEVAQARPSKFRRPESRHVEDQWESQKDHWYTKGDSPETQTEKLKNGREAFWPTPFYQYLECADGRHIRLASQGGDSAVRLLKALGLYRKLLDEGFVNVKPSEVASNTGPVEKNLANRFPATEEKREYLHKLISDVIRTKTAHEWGELLGEIAPCAMVRTRAEYLALEPMLESGILTKMNNGESTLTVPGHFVDVADPADNVETSFNDFQPISGDEAIAWFDEHFDESLPVNPHLTLRKGDLLKGVNVLEIMGGIACPMATYMMGLYGADVVVLAGPDWAGPSLVTMEVGQGKRCIRINSKNSPGQEVLNRLISESDIAVHNRLDDVAERLGLTHAQMQAVHPGIIDCQITACGGSKRGYWELRKGYDPIAQAVTGLFIHYGSIDNPQPHAETMIADSMCGYGAAFGSLLALYQRNRTGYAAEVRISLVQSANFIQLPYMIDEDGKNDWGEPKGQFTVGARPWQRMYECTDGWLYVGTRAERLPALAGIVSGDQEAGEIILEECFEKQPLAHWIQKLDEAGIACHKVMNAEDFCGDHYVATDNEEADETAIGEGKIQCWENHPCGWPVMVQRPDWVRVGESHSFKRMRPSPAVGQQSREILREIGYGENQVAQLVKLGVVIPT